MTDRLAELGGVIRQHFLPDDGWVFARDTSWSMAFLGLGFTMGGYFASDIAMTELCGATIPVISPSCAGVYTQLNQMLLLGSVGTVGLLVLATLLSVRSDTE